MRLRAFLALLVALACAFPAPRAEASGDPSVAALQVALRSRGLYGGSIDGVSGPATAAGVRRFQRKAGLAVDGVAGAQTRRALGRYGRHRLGSRLLSVGAAGWDVAALQFLLAAHGFPSGSVDGGFGPRTARAVLRFQRWARIGADGVVGHATLRALQAPPPRSPLALSLPLQAPIGDGFGPRGDRFHAGVDFPAAPGTGVAAARSGRVVYAGWHDGGWGYLVAIVHGHGLRTMYAHLSRVDVRLGQRVLTGFQVGLVGTTGHSTGPHLHFEVRVRGAAIDPLGALG